MERGWLVSYIALWVLVVVMAVVLLAHSRLLGILHYRFGPATAKQLTDGPEIGTKLDDLGADHLTGDRWHWRFPAQRELLLVFISPQCETCTALTPHLKDFMRTHRQSQIVLFSTLQDLGMNQAFVSYRKLQNTIYLLAGELADTMNIQGTPYAVRVDQEGVVVAKGLVNHYEHLLSLMLEPPTASAIAVNPS